VENRRAQANTLSHLKCARSSESLFPVAVLQCFTGIAAQQQFQEYIQRTAKETIKIIYSGRKMIIPVTKKRINFCCW